MEAQVCTKTWEERASLVEDIKVSELDYLCSEV